MRARFVLVVPLGILLSAFSAVADEKETAGPSSAAEAFSKGVELFNAEKHEEAVSAFRRAYELKPSWKLHYNIGQCEAALTRYGLAIEAFEAYLGEGGDKVPVDRRDEVLSELDRMRKMVGAVKVKGPEGVEIYIDDLLRGKTPINSSILVTAGVPHKIAFKKGGAEITTMRETIRGGETMDLEIPDHEAEEEATPPPPEPAPEEPQPLPVAQRARDRTGTPSRARGDRGGDRGGTGRRQAEAHRQPGGAREDGDHGGRVRNDRLRRCA